MMHLRPASTSGSRARALTCSSFGFCLFANAPCSIALGDGMTRRCGNSWSMIQPLEESTTSSSRYPPCSRLHPRNVELETRQRRGPGDHPDQRLVGEAGSRLPPSISPWDPASQVCSIWPCGGLSGTVQKVGTNAPRCSSTATACNPTSTRVPNCGLYKPRRARVNYRPSAASPKPAERRRTRQGEAHRVQINPGNG